jgi:hypothetical protein
LLSVPDPAAYGVTGTPRSFAAARARVGGGGPVVGGEIRSVLVCKRILILGEGKIGYERAVDGHTRQVHIWQ